MYIRPIYDELTNFCGCESSLGLRTMSRSLEASSALPRFEARLKFEGRRGKRWGKGSGENGGREGEEKGEERGWGKREEGEGDTHEEVTKTDNTGTTRRL